MFLRVNDYIVTSSLFTVENSGVISLFIGDVGAWLGLGLGIGIGVGLST
jgi:hypothetical protein